VHLARPPAGELERRRSVHRRRHGDRGAARVFRNGERHPGAGRDRSLRPMRRARPDGGEMMCDRQTSGVWSFRMRWLVFGALVGLAWAPTAPVAAQAEIDQRQIRPAVMLLVDTSGSMERRAASCVCTTAICDECYPA